MKLLGSNENKITKDKSGESKPLAKNVLIPLGLTAAAPASDVGTHKKVLGSETTALIISNDEMKNIMKVVKSLEDFGLLLKGVIETIQNEAKNKK